MLALEIDVLCVPTPWEGPYLVAKVHIPGAYRL
jgi:hypothetical protein